MDTIFISYVREDQRVVERIAGELRDHGARVWLDRDSIVGGDNWRESIRNAIEDGAFFVPCFSRNYRLKKDNYMNQELLVACESGGRFMKRGRWLIPVLLDASTVPRFSDSRKLINDVQYVEMAPSWADGLHRLLEATVEITKKRSRGELDRLAEQLYEAALALRQAESDLKQAQRHTIEEKVAHSLTRGEHHHSMPPMTDVTPYYERVSRATADRARINGQYQASVQQYVSRFGSSYDPYVSTVFQDRLREAESDMDASLQRKQAEEDHFKQRVRAVLWVLVVAAIVVGVVLV